MKSNSISEKGVFSSFSFIFFASSCRTIFGMSPSRVAKAKSSYRYLSPAMLICGRQVTMSRRRYEEMDVRRPLPVPAKLVSRRCVGPSGGQPYPAGTMVRNS